MLEHVAVLVFLRFPPPSPQSGLPELTEMGVWEISLGAIRGVRNRLEIRVLGHLGWNRLP